jgi:exosortase A
LSLALLALALVHFDTFLSIVAIWSRSDTYVHGYFVIPIALYLIWTQRDALRGIVPAAGARALVPIAVAGVGWLAARLGGILVAEQYFAVATIPLLVWAVAGSRVARRILFPLCYLLLLVPVGEVLIPHLIKYTAAFAVAGLRLTGIPVLQEGNLLILPNSQWSVVEACSGLRYLIACVTIGLLSAYLTYRSWARRAAFVALSIAVPILANWIRAYLIISIGYFSSMRLAVGVDHLIYGWIFYAVVMVLLLWVGSRFADEKAPAGPPPAEEPRDTRPTAFVRTLCISCAAVLAAAVWPAWAIYAESRSGEGAPSRVSFSFPHTVGTWTAGGKPFHWEPHYVGAGFAAGRIYGHEDTRVGLHVALYAESRQGAELVSSSNGLLPPGDSAWRQLSSSRRAVSLSQGPLAVEESRLAGPAGELLVWKWYWISGRHTPSSAWAKTLEATETLRIRRPHSAGIVVFTDNDEDDAARKRLAEFVEAGIGSLESALGDMSR